MNKMEKEALFREIISEENTLRKMRFNNSPSYCPLIPFFFFLSGTLQIIRQVYKWLIS